MKVKFLEILSLLPVRERKTRKSSTWVRDYDYVTIGFIPGSKIASDRAAGCKSQNLPFGIFAKEIRYSPKYIVYKFYRGTRSTTLMFP